MKRLLWNPDENRLRAGWRIAVYFFGVASGGLSLIYLAQFLLGGRPSPGLGRELVMVGALAISTTALLPLARRFLDRRTTESLGLRFDRIAVLDLVFGWLLSGAMAGLFVLSLYLMGGVQFGALGWDSAMLAPLLLSFGLYLMVGWWEELFFRGYVFANLVSGLGLMIAIGVSCLLYGLMHSMNPNATLLSTGIIVGFGFLRLYGLLTTRQLWLSMGMHMGWNFFQGPVFGFAASGQGSFKLLSNEVVGPGWLTGGDFGPEGSVLILPVLGVALLVMRRWGNRTRPQAASSIGDFARLGEYDLANSAVV